MPKNIHAKERAAYAPPAAAEKVSAAKKTPPKHKRRVPPPSRASKPAPHKTAPLPAPHTLPKRQRRPKRMSIGEALRHKGIDEHFIARNYKRAVSALKKKKKDPEAGTVQKLLVDVLKECSRQIEASDEAERAASPGAPVIVQLVHNIPRPDRAPTGSS